MKQKNNTPTPNATKYNITFCCICRKEKGTLKITDGNPKYRNKLICKICQAERKLLQETK